FPAWIQFDWKDPAQQSLRVPIDGRGVQADWSVTPRALAFRTQLLGEVSEAQWVTLTNTSRINVQVQPALLDGPGAAQFEVSREPPAIPGDMTPLTLRPDQSVKYRVTCHPRSPGQHVASLVLNAASGPPVRIALAANAVAATLARPTVEYSFGDVVV